MTVLERSERNLGRIKQEAASKEPLTRLLSFNEKYFNQNL